MPLYEYRCGACKRVFEAYTRLSEESKSAACPMCGAASEKIGISVVNAAGAAGGSRSEGACGSGPRRSPFS